MIRGLSLGAALVSMLLAAALPANAGSPITEFPQAALDTLDLENLPSPAQATRIAARNTMIPLAVGSGIFALGLASPQQTGGAFLLGTLIVAGGIIVGPAPGYMYGGVKTRGALGVTLRLGLVAATPVVVAGQPGVRGSEDAGLAVVFGAFLGLGLAALSDVWDIALVGRHVEQHNRELRARASPATSLRVEPCVTPFAHAPGVALAARF